VPTTTRASYFQSQGLHLEMKKVFIVRDENGARVETKTFFSLPFERILELFIKRFEHLYKWTRESRGRQPFSAVTMVKAILYAKLNKNMSDRALERHLIRFPEIAHALGFKRIPSHHTFSFFKRERLSVELLEEVFNALRDHLVTLDLIDFKSVTMDSAPIIARVNLAKANREPVLNVSLTRALLEDSTHQSLASQLVNSLGYKNSTRVHGQSRTPYLNIVLLSELGGFLSQSKVFKYLAKKDHVELFTRTCPAQKLPSQATISNFKKRLLSGVHSPEFISFRTFLDSFFCTTDTHRTLRLTSSFPGYLACYKIHAPSLIPMLG